jgi:hypothetical protein
MPTYSINFHVNHVIIRHILENGRYKIKMKDVTNESQCFSCVRIMASSDSHIPPLTLAIVTEALGKECTPAFDGRK